MRTAPRKAKHAQTTLKLWKGREDALASKMAKKYDCRAPNLLPSPTSTYSERKSTKEIESPAARTFLFEEECGQYSDSVECSSSEGEDITTGDIRTTDPPAKAKDLLKSAMHLCQSSHDNDTFERRNVCVSNSFESFDRELHVLQDARVQLLARLNRLTDEGAHLCREDSSVAESLRHKVFALRNTLEESRTRCAELQKENDRLQALLPSVGTSKQCNVDDRPIACLHTGNVSTATLASAPNDDMSPRRSRKMTVRKKSFLSLRAMSKRNTGGGEEERSELWKKIRGFARRRGLNSRLPKSAGGSLSEKNANPSTNEALQERFNALVHATRESENRWRASRSRTRLRCALEGLRATELQVEAKYRSLQWAFLRLKAP